MFRDDKGLMRRVDYTAGAEGFKAVVSSNEPGLGTENPADVQMNVQVSFLPSDQLCWRIHRSPGTTRRTPRRWVVEVEEVMAAVVAAEATAGVVEVTLPQHQLRNPHMAAVAADTHHHHHHQNPSHLMVVAEVDILLHRNQSLHMVVGEAKEAGMAVDQQKMVQSAYSNQVVSSVLPQKPLAPVKLSYTPISHVPYQGGGYKRRKGVGLSFNHRKPMSPILAAPPVIVGANSNQVTTVISHDPSGKSRSYFMRAWQHQHTTFIRSSIFLKFQIDIPTCKLNENDKIKMDFWCTFRKSSSCWKVVLWRIQICWSWLWRQPECVHVRVCQEFLSFLPKTVFGGVEMANQSVPQTLYISQSVTQSLPRLNKNHLHKVKCSRNF